MDTSTTNWFESTAAVSQAALESTNKLSELIGRTQGQLMRHQLAAVESWLETGATQMKLVLESGNPVEAFGRGTDALMALGEQINEITRDSFQIQAEINREFMSWLREGWQRASKLPEEMT